jgi:hypothetical protein
MSFVVLRIEKLKTPGNIGGLNKHLTRTMAVPNADPELIGYNSRPIGTEDLNSDIQNRIDACGIHPRKNAVLAVEHLMTSGKEAFDYHKAEDGSLRGNVPLWKAFEENSMRWLTDRYGKENVVNFTVHKDEQTPHIHAVVVPVVNGKLNCRALLGGRDKLRAMQTGFAKLMEPLGLERGIEGSRAEHTTIREYYGMLNQAKATAIKMTQPAPAITLSAIPTLIGHKQWKEQQEQRINEKVGQHVKDSQKMAESFVLLQKENEKLKAQVKAISKENVQLRDNAKIVRDDIRKILITEKIYNGMRETYIPDIIKKELQEKQAAEKQQPRTWDNTRGMGM